MTASAEPIDVVVSLPSLLAAATGGLRDVTVQATTFRGALDALVASYPLLQVHLFDERGNLRQHVHVFWNDQEARWIEEWNAPLRRGDTLTVLQAVSGG
jgi:molybdopterin converting factor small subunit